MTQQELLTVARNGRPNVRYAASRQGNAIGAWVNGRWVMVASCLANDPGTWVFCKYELLVNGKPVFAASDWVE